MTLLWPYSSPPFLYPLCLEASFQSPFSLPARTAFCPLVLKPGTLSVSKCADCMSCLWMQLLFWSWNSEGLQPSNVALIAHSLHRKLECLSVHGWLRCAGMGDKGVGGMQRLLTGGSYVGKRGRQHSDKVSVSALGICLGCCIVWGRVLSSALAHVGFAASARKGEGPPISCSECT